MRTWQILEAATGPRAGTITDVTITPDTKDWTWILRRPCPECGFQSQSVERDKVGDLLRATIAHWPATLNAPDAKTRQQPDKWSALEYGCHVRDVCRLFRERLDLMLTKENPLFPNWDQDQTAIADAYGQQDPAAVAGDLEAAAEKLARAFENVTDWERTGRRSDGAQFTIDTFARYFLHDVIHHRYDVTGKQAD